VVEAPFGGAIWKLLVKPGEPVEKGAAIAVIEAMKMESEVNSPAAGIVRRIYVQEKQAVNPGAPLLAIEIDAQRRGRNLEE
jgi:urea carboxylase